jgi:hypothetical protein
MTSIFPALKPHGRTGGDFPPNMRRMFYGKTTENLPYSAFF